MIPLTSGPAMKGSAAQVADQMEDWYMSGACDGLMIGMPVSPKGHEDFVDLVVPELQRRSPFRTESTGRTLRENLDLPAPSNQFFGLEHPEWVEGRGDQPVRGAFLQSPGPAEMADPRPKTEKR